MPLTISNHSHNLGTLAYLAKPENKGKKLITSHPQNLFTEDAWLALQHAKAIRPGKIFHTVKWIKSLTAGLLTTAGIAGAIGGLSYAGYQNRNEIGSFLSTHASSLTTGGITTLGITITAAALSKDIREIVKFAIKGTLVGIPFAGYKVGQRVFANGDKEAEKHEKTAQIKREIAVQDLHRVYQGMATYAQGMVENANRSDASKMKITAQSISSFFPTIFKSYERQGISEDEARLITRELRGALET